MAHCQLRRFLVDAFLNGAASEQRQQLAPPFEPPFRYLLTLHKGCYVLLMGKAGEPTNASVATDNRTVSQFGNDSLGGVDFVPVVIAEVGSDATRSFLSFFVDQIRIGILAMPTFGQ